MGGIFTLVGVVILIFTFIVSAFAAIPFVGGISGLNVIADNARILYMLGLFFVFWGIVNSILISGTLTLIIGLLLVFVLQWI